MTKAEHETTVTYDMEDQLVRIFSSIGRDQGKLKRAGFTPVYGTPARGFGYVVPLARFRWRVTTGKGSRRGFASRNPHTNGESTTRKGIPDAPSV